MITLVEQLRTRKGLLSLREVAEILGCHPMTVRKRAKNGTIAFVREGNRIKFDPAVVVAYLVRRTG